MPSFDIVSQVDQHELANAVDQANREIGTRFDFRGSGATITRDDYQLTLRAATEFQVKQMLDILEGKLARRGIDIQALERGPLVTSLHEARQQCTVRTGIDADLARRLVRIIKDSKLRVQAAIQHEQLRVTGKQRDDLQAAIALLRKQALGMPLQYVNFRD